MNPFNFQQGKMPLKNKIGLAVFLMLGFFLLFFFAFTAFLIAAVFAVIGFLVNLLQRPTRLHETRSGPSTRPYRPPKSRDDDVIDI